MADDRSLGRCPFDHLSRFVQREGKRAVVGIVGGMVVIAGIVLMPLPGPGMLVVLAGLAILATQFEWAQDLLDRVRTKAKDALDRMRDREGDDHDGDHSPADDPVDTSDADPIGSGATGGQSDVA